LLAERGTEPDNIPHEWWLWIEEEGYIVCNRYKASRDAIDFSRKLAERTGCDIVLDLFLWVRPAELTPARGGVS
jgi:hypothetical protein